MHVIKGDYRMKKRLTYGMLVVLAGMTLAIVSVDSGADLRCAHTCVLGTDCRSTTDPCANHTPGLPCWRCDRSHSTVLCVPAHGKACDIKGISGHGLCGNMWRSTCNGSLQCLGGQKVGDCEREIC